MVHTMQESTATLPSAPFHCPPRPILPGSPRCSLSLYIDTLCFVVTYSWGPFSKETNKHYAPTSKHSTARSAKN